MFSAHMYYVSISEHKILNTKKLSLNVRTQEKKVVAVEEDCALRNSQK